MLMNCGRLIHLKQVDEAQRAAVNDFLGVQSNYFKARIEVLLSET